jgi:hypothetical protein
MQTQPKSGQRLERALRARQARERAEDAFRGGDPMRGKLPLSRPWMMGTGRLWNARRSGPQSG